MNRLKQYGVVSILEDPIINEEEGNLTPTKWIDKTILKEQIAHEQNAGSFKRNVWLSERRIIHGGGA